MYGHKLCWTGLGLIAVAEIFAFGQPFTIAGAIILAIGVIAMWLDK